MQRRTFLAGLLAPPPLRLGVIGTGNRGTSLALLTASMPDVEITAICDIQAAQTDRLLSRLPRPPRVFSKHQALLDFAALDAVLIATPEQTHARIAIDTLNAGKAVLSEVAAAVTIEECWQLVEAVERTRGFYMMAENCCYYRSNLAVLAMARAGLFGDLTYAECSYLHSLPHYAFQPQGGLSWRGELMRDYANWYPTHAIGPVAHWLGLGKSHRLASLTARTAPPLRMNSQREGQRFLADASTALIETTQGKLITLRLDTVSARPTVSTTHYLLQGTRGAFRDAEGQRSIWIEGVHRDSAWGDWEPYERRYDDPRWQANADRAKASGHGGADWFTIRAFVEALQLRQPSPINVYDSVEWSSLIALTTQSARAQGSPVLIPDFRRNQK
jgi:predicted dehydrogenase